MADNLKQDLNFLENPIWLQNPKDKSEGIKWTDGHGYTFMCNYGAPNKVDAVILYFLLLECQNQNWSQDITLSRYQVLTGCGITPSKKKYERLEESLERWKFTGIRFSGTFYNGVEYESLSFGIIDDWSIRKGDKKLRVHLNRYWVQKIRESDFFRYISFVQIKQLRSPLALRLYELLVKTFYRRDTWEIDALKLAAKIPMPEKYFSDIAPRVKAATRRIKEKTELKISVKVVKQGRGKGKFIFTKTSPQKPKQRDLFTPKTDPVPAAPPADIMQMIPDQWRHDAADIAAEIFRQDGSVDLEQCIAFVNRAIDGGREVKGYGRYLRSVWTNGWHKQAAEARAADEQARAAAKVQQERAFLESRRQMPDAILKIDADRGCAISQRVLEERKK